MSMSVFGIALNLLLVALLLVAVVVGLRLGARLKALKAGQKDFVKAVGDLDSAALRAQESLAELKASGEELTDRLSRQVAQAAALAERLERGIGRAIQAAPTRDAQVDAARDVLARAKAQAVLPNSSASGREAPSPSQETRRSRARVDDDLFEPQSGSPLRSIPGGRRE